MSRKSRIDVARAYDKPPLPDGARLLVDRIWPRGVSRTDLGIDEWIADVAPSTELRQWFAHDPERWDEFQRRYRAELDARPEAVDRCLAWCRRGAVVLLFGARDRDHNQAVALRDYLNERLKPR